MDEKEHGRADDKEMANIPYFAHEAATARLEKINRRLVYAVIICIILVVFSNIAWLTFLNQYEMTSEETVTVDGKDGIANYIGNDGDVRNGESGSSEEAVAEEEKR